MIALVAVLGAALALVTLALLVSRSSLAAAQLRAGELERELGAVSARVAARDADRARLADSFERLAVGVVIVDESGHEVLRNSAAAAYAAPRHSEALVGAAVEDVLAAARDGRTSSQTLDLFGPPRRSVVISARPLRTAMGAGAVALIEDVSELRHLEGVRRDFVANISHELKTPVGALGLLAETLVNEEEPAVRERLAERIQAEAFRVARTIDDLLELSRIEGGEAPPRERVGIDLAIDQAVARIRPAAEQTGIALHVDPPPAQLAVLGDRRQLVSALFNLLDNAVKYSGDRVDVLVDVSSSGGLAVLQVTDRGVGMPAGETTRVFKRFYRVPGPLTQRVKGTGLGLFIVQSAARRHGGRARAASAGPGHGSTFSIELPLAPPADAA